MRFPTLVAILDIGSEQFYNSESLCRSDASHQVWVQSALRIGRRHLKNIKMATMASSWMPKWNELGRFESPPPPTMPPTKFKLNLTLVREQDGGHLGYRNGTNLAILNLHVSQIPPTKFGFNPTYLSVADMVRRNLRWPPLGGGEGGYDRHTAL